MDWKNGQECCRINYRTQHVDRGIRSILSDCANSNVNRAARCSRQHSCRISDSVTNRRSSQIPCDWEGERSAKSKWSGW